MGLKNIFVIACVCVVTLSAGAEERNPKDYVGPATRAVAALDRVFVACSEALRSSRGHVFTELIDAGVLKASRLFKKDPVAYNKFAIYTEGRVHGLQVAAGIVEPSADSDAEVLFQRELHPGSKVIRIHHEIDLFDEAGVKQTYAPLSILILQDGLVAQKVPSSLP